MNTAIVEAVKARAKLTPYEPLVLLGAEKLAWKRFRWAVEALAKAEFGPAGLKTFYAAVGAYRELRDAHINKRRRGKTEGKDESLEYWAKQKADFRTKFFGIDEGSWVGQGEDRKWKAKRRFKGCLPDVVQYMRAYQSLWNAWWPHTPGGLDSKKKANARQAKRPEVKAAKLVASKTEAGKATKKAAKAKARQAAKVAKGVAQQALYDSWATEAVIEEVLRDV